ncbi:MAG TPA: methyltransferase domain-containing protein [Nitrosopumilaceae archaeon]|nr:methyltransferase domain-containing protein [Nitrosopumilaceae archaeon]
MIPINPLQILFWTFRRSEEDVVNLYDSLLPLMQLATGGDMLNFGYWDETAKTPLEAQQKLCSMVGNLAELSSANTVADLGSGLSAPAVYWKAQYNLSHITCLNINFKQLKNSTKSLDSKISFVNATSTALPFASNSVDRVIALESAQHFKPLKRFIQESKRILKQDGLFVIAIPVSTNGTSLLSLFKLGILSLTWSSEHYTLEEIRSTVLQGGFHIKEVQTIGNRVYEPLADYYINNREKLRAKILKEYPSYLENILFKSLLKMKEVSKNKTIDYALIKCNPA